MQNDKQTIRTFCFMVSFLFCHGLFAQQSLSYGIHREFIGLYYQDYKERMWKGSVNEPYILDVSTLRFDFKMENLILGAEIYGYYKNLDTRTSIVNTQYISGGYYDRETNVKTANVRFAHMGLNFSLDRMFFPQKKLNLLVGGFMSCGFIAFEKESNHYDTTYYSSYKLNHNFITGEITNVYSSSEGPVSRDPFDALVHSTRMRIGMNYKLRYNFLERYYFEVFYRLGFSSRLLYDNAEYVNFPDHFTNDVVSISKLFQNFGLTFGDYLK